ncbi:hypothetical protein B0H16DRAFT_1334580 [Mycena metata]|uniref:Uncharacterized protein n=1 Tax=Mycena metata TaxID=1033252 RepID=A0AAD7HKC3_9AGAR|nr:hypothetical protein B0H16DRAFT_1334580 [Mycena metata]
MNVKDSKRRDYLHCDLAPTFGDLNSASVRKLDAKLKVMIAGTMRILDKIPPKQRTWDGIIASIRQKNFVEPDGDPVARKRKLTKGHVNVFKFDGSPDPEILVEVEEWFAGLIGKADRADVLRSTKIDLEILADIVAQTGATIDSVESLIFKGEVHQKTLVDIGVLRFPDMDHPYFKVYHIRLDAWSRSHRVLMVQNDANGITGVFECQRFRPRASFINKLKRSVRDQAIAEAEAMFKSPSRDLDSGSDDSSSDSDDSGSSSEESGSEEANSDARYQ